MSALQTNDLRSEAKSYQRDKNHTTKWARGGNPAPGKKCPHNMAMLYETACAVCVVRPISADRDRREGRHATKFKQAQSHKLAAQKTTLARKVFRNEVVDAMDGPLAMVSELSSDEEGPVVYMDAVVAPVPESEGYGMYTYEAYCDLNHGDHVLSYAVNKAVQRFENHETEKLVKEYDLVLDGKDDADAYAAYADDDFEMIDHAHVK